MQLQSVLLSVRLDFILTADESRRERKKKTIKNNDAVHISITIWNKKNS